MTLKQAHKRAVALLGKRARVEVRPNAGRIGHHGEFVPAHLVFTATDLLKRHGQEQRQGRYRCRACSSKALEGDDLIEREVYHLAGGKQSAYYVGFVDSFLGAFHIRAEGGSWAECFAQLEPKEKAAS